MIQNRPERPHYASIFSRKPLRAGVGLVNEFVVNNSDDIKMGES